MIFISHIYPCLFPQFIMEEDDFSKKFNNIYQAIGYPMHSLIVFFFHF